MAHKFAEIAFTPTVRDIQVQQGSRKAYARLDEGPDAANVFTEREAAFIAERDSFYMATVSQTGWPYMQHRGGLRGFVQVLDEKRIGFLDYRGNRQYVSVGNLQDDDRVSLFFMDYAQKARLKILGHARVVSLDEAQELGIKLPEGSTARPERAMVIEIEGFDWNCPQHITERYTLEQVQKLIAPLQERIDELEEALEQGRA